MKFWGWSLQGLGRRAGEWNKRRAPGTGEREKAHGGQVGRELRQAGLVSRDSPEKDWRKTVGLVIKDHWHPPRGQVVDTGGTIHEVYPILELMTLLIVFCFHLVQFINSSIASGLWVMVRMGINAILMGLIWLGLLNHVIDSVLLSEWLVSLLGLDLSYVFLILLQVRLFFDISSWKFCL